jgi:organic hydroperoxide reductase OsmC/OhrA
VSQHTYELTVRWTGNTGEGTRSYRGYDRTHEVEAEGGLVLPGSSDPAFRGDPGRWNPEQLFVASLSQCHLLWYLHLCSVNGVVVVSYEDRPRGVLELDDSGGGRFSSVVLRPAVAVTEESMVERATALHRDAHARCFIANSVSVPVTHEPTTAVAQTERSPFTA